MGPARPDPERTPAAREREVHLRHVERRRVWLAGLPLAELVDEHDRVGQEPSPMLASLLVAMRQAPVKGKLALLRQNDGTLAMLRLSGVQGVAHDVLGVVEAAADHDARHVIFMQRLRELDMEPER